MSPITIIGFALLIIGASLAYFGLHTSDSLFLLQSSLWHFFEHMQTLWGQMAQTPRIYLAAGGVFIVIALLLFLMPKRKPTRSEYF